MRIMQRLFLSRFMFMKRVRRLAYCSVECQSELLAMPYIGDLKTIDVLCRSALRTSSCILRISMIALPFQDRQPRNHLDKAGIEAERQLAHYLGGGCAASSRRTRASISSSASASRSKRPHHPRATTPCRSTPCSSTRTAWRSSNPRAFTPTCE